MIVRTLEPDHPREDKPHILLGNTTQELDAQHFRVIQDHVSYVSMEHLGEPRRKRKIELAAKQGRYGEAVQLWHTSQVVQQIEYAPRTWGEEELPGTVPYDLDSDSGNSQDGDDGSPSSDSGDDAPLPF